MSLHIRHLRGEEELRHVSVLGSGDEDVALAWTTRQSEEWGWSLISAGRDLAARISSRPAP